MTKKSFKNLLLCIPIGLVIFSGINNVGAVPINTTTSCSTTELTKTPVKIKSVAGRGAGYFYEFSIGGNIALCLDPGLAMGDNKKYTLTERTLKNPTLVAQAYSYAKRYSDNIDKRILAQVVVWESEAGTSDAKILTSLISVFNSRGSFDGAKTKIDIISKVTSAYNELKGINANIQLQIFADLGNSNSYQDLVTANVQTKLCEDITYCTDKNGAPVNLKEKCSNSGNFDDCVNQYCNFCFDKSGNRVDVYQKCDRSKLSDADFNNCYNTVCSGPTDEEYNCEIDVVSELPVCSDKKSNSGRVFEGTKGTCTSGYRENINEVTDAGKAVDNYGKYCRLYCLNSVELEYPGNVLNKVYVGGHLVWPNSINETEEKRNADLTLYPMSFEARKVCKMYVNTTLLKKEYGDIYYTYLKDNAGFKYKKTDNKEYWKEYSSFDGYGIVDFTATDRANDKDVCMTKDLKNLININENCKKGTRANGDSSYVTWYVNSAGSKWTDSATCKANNNNADCSTTQGVDCTEENGAITNYKTDWGYAECEKYATAYKKAKEEILNNLNSFCIKNISLDENDDLNKVNIDYKVSYNDPYYKNSEFNLKSANGSGFSYIPSVSIETEPINVDMNVLENNVNIIQAQNINYGFYQEYNLADNYYYYVDSKTNKSKNSNKNLKNYITIGYSNLPISFNADTNKTYKLTITPEISGIFENEINKKYTCKYQVKDKPDDCKCPSGTLNEGMNLDCYIEGVNQRVSKNEIREEMWACTDAQAILCDQEDSSEWICKPYEFCYDKNNVKHTYNEEAMKKYSTFEEFTEEECDIPNPVCPDDESKELQSCINRGFSYEECKESLCDPIKCPESSNATDSMSQDFSDCVFTTMLNGYNREEAEKACNVYCYPGTKIIYRTISLQNPFPSYDADKNIYNENELKTITYKIGIDRKSKFNMTVVGRYPGSNWNGEQTVATKILKNRGVYGDEVYNLEPLYTIILDSTKIKEIRKYNKKHSYSDFTLQCKMNNSAACMSTFLRNTELNLITDGTCKNISNSGNDFYKCDD